MFRCYSGKIALVGEIIVLWVAAALLRKIVQNEWKRPQTYNNPQEAISTRVEPALGEVNSEKDQEPDEASSPGTRNTCAEDNRSEDRLIVGFLYQKLTS